MLDYSTTEIVKPYIQQPPMGTKNIILCSVITIVLITLACLIKSELAKGLLVAAMTMLLAGAVYSSRPKKVALIKIEVSGIEMKSEIYPSADKYPYLKKEDNKIYYYIIVNRESLNDPSEIIEETKSEFEGTLKNLNNQNK